MKENGEVKSYSIEMSKEELQNLISSLEAANKVCAWTESCGFHAQVSVGPWVGRVEFQQGFNASYFTDTLDQAQKILCWDVVEMFNST